jgi:hypothetical protein
VDQQGCYNYVPEGGVFFGDEVSGDYIQHRGIAMQRAGVSGKIRRVEVYYNYAFGGVEDVSVAAEIIYGGDYTQWGYDEIPMGADEMIRRSAYRELEDGVLGIGLYTDMRYGSQPAFTGSCKISRVVVYGEDLAIT